MKNYYTVIVRANEDLDDCLKGAAEEYVEDHPMLAGWDLEPRWTDEDDRETVTLTVPLWSLDAGDYLATYEHPDWVDSNQPDYGSRCGYADMELNEIKRALRGRDLRLEADDVGLRVVSRA